MYRVIIAGLLGFFLAGFTPGLIAAENDFKNGFLWNRLPKENLKDRQSPQKKGVPFERLSYQDRTRVLHYLTMEALHKARFSHDVKDMEKFLQYQRYWLNEASAFQHNFQYALLLNPSLNSTVKNPVSSIGEQLNAKKRSLALTGGIERITKENGLYFFYEGADNYSQKQAEVLKDFARRYGFAFIAVSVDGIRLESLPQSQIDNGQARALGVHTFPAIIMVNPKTGRTMPLAYGFVTQDYLSQNISVVLKQFAREQKGEGVLYE